MTRGKILKNFSQSGESQVKKVYLLLKDKINVGLEKCILKESGGY